MGQERKNPFTPNWGVIPPYRAGHTDVELDLNEMLDHLLDREPVGGVVLYGPRGTGKTVLLREIRKQATEQDIEVRALNPGNWGDDANDFVDRLASSVDIDKHQMGGDVEIDLIIAKLRISRNPTVSKVTAEDVLRLMAKTKPVALFVDEAHELPPDIAVRLLNAAQGCVGDGLPLLLVLAGTPAIEENLSRAHASFWERSHLLRIGRLESEDDIRAALAMPAEMSGLPFAPDALERLVAESQGYPYFIQLVGARAWKAAIRRDPGADRILLEDAEAGVRKANMVRDAFYQRRLREINRRKILSEAQAVSKAFAAIGGDGVLPETKLHAELESVLAGDRTAHDALEELFAVGLIWRTDDRAFWEPGIPSLCTHIANCPPPKAR